MGSEEAMKYGTPKEMKSRIFRCAARGLIAVRNGCAFWTESGTYLDDGYVRLLGDRMDGYDAEKTHQAYENQVEELLCEAEEFLQRDCSRSEIRMGIGEMSEEIMKGEDVDDLLTGF